MLHLVSALRVYATMNASKQFAIASLIIIPRVPKLNFVCRRDCGGSPNEQFRCNEGLNGVDLYVLS